MSKKSQDNIPPVILNIFTLHIKEIKRRHNPIILATLLLFLIQLFITELFLFMAFLEVL